MKKIFSIFLMNVSLLFLCANIYSSEESVSISGRISRSSAAGVSLNDINIDVTGTQNVRTKTDRYGNYIIHGLPKGGIYTLTVSKAGYSFSPNVKTYRGLTESKINENFTATVSNFSISGKVLVGGKPIRGALVMVSHRNIKYFTDYDGSYVIDNLEYDGPYTVSVISNEHFFQPFTIEFLDKDIIHNFEKDISASGRVTSLGQGVDNAEIDVNGVKYKTDEQGFYKIKGLTTNGDYIINVSNSNNLVVSPKTIALRKITQDEEDLNFSVYGSISGNVTYNGKPFMGAIINISNRDKEYKTNSSGFYKIDELGVNQEYIITISSTGYLFSPKSKTIKKLLIEPSIQDFTVSIAKYKVIVTVMEGRTPVKDADVTVSGIKDIFKTNENGKCEISKLNYGKDYTISVKKQGVSFIESKKTVKNLDKDTEFIFEGLLSISGTVKNFNTPIKDAIITYGEKLNVKTNKDGQYSINNLKPNKSYTISVSSNNFTFKPDIIVIDDLSNKEINRSFITENKEKIAIETKLKEDLRIQAEQIDKAAAETKAKENIVPQTEISKAEPVVELTKEEKKRLEKEEKIRIKAEKEEQKRLAKEEKTRIKAEQEEQKRLAKEEAKRQALELEEQKIAEKEAELKAKESLVPQAEISKPVESALPVLQLTKEEQDTIDKAAAETKAKENIVPQAEISKAEPVVELTKEEKKRLEKEEKIRIKAEKEEQKRLAKEEKTRIKAEQEEQKRLAKEEAKRQALELEEQKIAEKEAELKQKEDLKIQAEQEAQAKRDEETRIKAEQAEKERIEKEAAELKQKEDLKIQAEQEAQAKRDEETRIKAEQAEKERIEKTAAEVKAKESSVPQAEISKPVDLPLPVVELTKEDKKKLEKEEKIRIKAEKEEQKRLAKEEAKRKELELEEQKKVEKEAELKQKEELEIQAQEIINSKKEKFTISGRVLKGKMGVQGVQVRLLIDDEERIYLTDNNGFYKIPDVVEGYNYTITVISGKEMLNLSPKTRTYKKITKNISNQNFYVIEKFNSKNKGNIKPQVKQEVKDEQKKEVVSSEDDDYGLRNKNGLIQAEIHW
ncbi:MAG: hypothetical protein PHT81_02705 [Endomicrobiaceae bacterium]|nr:hypothetical protein [Endomicrobiaceae bacterium]